jgi:DNA helicase-2/ATP-dependent DNA helicase PcrA
MSFFDRREVRDLLAYLKLISNAADDVALLRIINVPPRGIGQASVERLMAKAVQQGVPLWEMLPNAGNDGEIPFRAAQAISEFCQLTTSARTHFNSPPLAQRFRELIQLVDYRSEVVRNYKEPQDQESRWNSVEELVNAMAQYEERHEQPTIQGFLENIALAGREEENDKESKLDRNAVVLMTMHSAKGLEFPNVYMVGMEQGLLPHERAVKEGRRAIAEERRLAYVGITRARDRLTLTWAKSRTKWGKRRATIVSQFLAEMRGESPPPKPRKSRAATTKKKGSPRISGKRCTNS